MNIENQKFNFLTTICEIQNKRLHEKLFAKKYGILVPLDNIVKFSVLCLQTFWSVFFYWKVKVSWDTPMGQCTIWIFVGKLRIFAFSNVE